MLSRFLSPSSGSIYEQEIQETIYKTNKVQETYFLNYKVFIVFDITRPDIKLSGLIYNTSKMYSNFKENSNS